MGLRRPGPFKSPSCKPQSRHDGRMNIQPCWAFIYKDRLTGHFVQLQKGPPFSLRFFFAFTRDHDTAAASHSPSERQARISTFLLSARFSRSLLLSCEMDRSVLLLFIVFLIASSIPASYAAAFLDSKTQGR